MDAVRDYVPLGKLEVGTVLHVQGGGEAVLVSKTWRQGEFAAERSDVGESPERSAGTVRVFDFEVEGLHNFYVRGEGSDAAGVLVHNSTPSISPQARGRASETRVLDDLGLDKNTRRVSTSEGGSIPDAVVDGAFYEIKDTKSASNTRQMRIQREAAAAEGKEHVLITGTNTRVSGPLGEASTVIRRDDLGPQ